MSTMVAYFPTREQAQKAANRLNLLFQVSEPEAGETFNGRPWRITVTLPASSMSLYPDPAWSSQVVSAVLAFDGLVHSQDQP